MDSRLQKRLDKWHSHIGELERIERECLSLEANEKPLWSSIFLESEGKNVAEREARAYASPVWRNFMGGMVEAKVAANKAKRELELKQAAFNCEYLRYKLEGEAVQRTPRMQT